MKVVPFQQVNVDDVIAIHARVHDHLNLEFFLWQPCQQIESLENDCIRYVYLDDEIKGYGAAYPLDETHFRLNLLVDPRYAGQGVGTSLLREVEREVARRGGRYLQSRIMEGMDRSLAFAASKGFREIHRMRGMSLHAEDFSFEKWKELGAKLSAEGFSATSFKREDEAHGDPVNKLAKLLERAREGWPSPDPTQRGHMVQGELHSLFTDIKAPEHFSIMKLKDEYVAYTSVHGENRGGTAVHPDYRGRGVATYLKAYDIKKCLDDGKQYFESCSANPAMHRVNEKLGYSFNGLTEVRFVKDLQA